MFFFKVWLEESVSNFERPLIFFLLFLSAVVNIQIQGPREEFPKIDVF